MEVSKLFSQKHYQISILLLIFVSLFSCGTYQSVYNYDDDGIYSSNNPVKEEIVIVEKSEFDKNYFSHQLDELQGVGEDDIFTDVDEYYYNDDSNQEDSSKIENNSPWEYATDVTISINNDYNSFGYYGYNPFYYPYDNYYNHYYNPWSYSRYYSPYYSSYRYNPYYYSYYGYNNYYYGISNYGGYYNYNNYYSPSYNGYSKYDRYDSYGKRTAYNTTSRRNSTTSQATTRRSSTNANTSSSSRRLTNNSIRSRRH